MTWAVSFDTSNSIGAQSDLIDEVQRASLPNNASLEQFELHTVSLLSKCHA